MYSFKGFGEDKKLLTGSIVVTAIVALGYYRWYKSLSKEEGDAKELPVVKAFRMPERSSLDPNIQNWVDSALEPYFNESMKLHMNNFMKSHSIVSNDELRELRKRVDQQAKMINAIVGQIVGLTEEQADQAGSIIAFAEKGISAYGWDKKDELVRKKYILSVKENFFKALRGGFASLDDIQDALPSTDDAMSDYLEKLIATSSGRLDGVGAADEDYHVVEVVGSGSNGFQAHELID